MKKYIIIMSVFLLANISCSENDKNDCIENKLAYVTSVDSPSSGVINEIINIEVNFGVSNGCGQFGEFIETENRNVKIIEVKARYEGCVCTQDAPIRTVNYEFATQTSGDYELRFKSNDTDYITVNLLIE
ncbi:MAG: hypothetical protein R3342_00010 [Lutibacter sp.]|uniref:hypothetical protein n=1 Tax=Lutibacter sp. TaxID=1925666 RepID=UPI00299E0543|nr:hypothetical protein [Lutibacter sp.]MDX1827904.1 hypothetical protein [Lutibacter sp.]